MDMRQDLMGTLQVKDRSYFTASQNTSAKQSSSTSLTREGADSKLSLTALAALCLGELRAYRRGEAFTEKYGLELLRRAIVQGEPEAWTWVERCFRELVQGWLRRHPKREVACRLESEENYIAQAFERFWQATTLTQRVEFRTLAAALQYLRASLNGAILDTLRSYSRLREVSLPEPGEPGEPNSEDYTNSTEVWDILQTMLPNKHEQRLAYLLFYCGLKPREIMRFLPQEWSDVQDIYRLRRTILERLQRHADQLRWRLTSGEEG